MATPRDGFNLLMEGAVALAEIEGYGVRIDVDYLENTIASTTEQIRILEDEFRKEEVWYIWRREYGERANLGSREQLSNVLFNVMGFPSPGETGSSTQEKIRHRADAEALGTVDLPAVRRYLGMEGKKKLLNTFLKGLQRETVDGYFHPIFNLHTARTFRSSSGRDKDDERSSRDLNFQNLPIRSEELGNAIRRCFIPREGCVLVEADFGALEFRICAAVWNDPKMMAYASDPKKDIHRDTAANLFLCKNEQVSKQYLRYCAKNQFVFPILYGSYYVNCARKTWDYLKKHQATMADGSCVFAWLTSQGVKELGDCNPRETPRKGTFEREVKRVEDFFNEEFSVWSSNRDKLIADYQETGSFKLVTGFEIKGIYGRTEVLNFIIQGPGFHCLLWSLTQVHRWLLENRMKCRIVGQVHDCLLLDCPVNELQDVLYKINNVMTVELPAAWKWISVPLAVEVDVTPENGDWSQKKPWIVGENSKWQPAKK